MKDIRNFEAPKYTAGSETKEVESVTAVTGIQIENHFTGTPSLEEMAELFQNACMDKKFGEGINAVPERKERTLLYKRAEDGIYVTEDVHGIADGDVFVTSLSFVQEPEYREGDNASDISQYPLECLLDEFGCWVSDFYEELNTADSQICYQEFASDSIDNIRKLRSVIGKHVYIKWEETKGDMVIE